MVLNLRTENTYKAIMSSSHTVIHGSASATSSVTAAVLTDGPAASSAHSRDWANSLDAPRHQNAFWQTKSNLLCTNKPAGLFIGTLSCNPQVSWLPPELGVKMGVSGGVSHEFGQPFLGASLMFTSKKSWQLALPRLRGQRPLRQRCLCHGSAVQRMEGQGEPSRKRSSWAHGLRYELRESGCNESWGVFHSDLGSDTPRPKLRQQWNN